MTKSWTWPVAGANVIITYFFNIIEHLGSNSKRCSKQKGSRKETNNEKDFNILPQKGLGSQKNSSQDLTGGHQEN